MVDPVEPAPNLVWRSIGRLGKARRGQSWDRWRGRALRRLRHAVARRVKNSLVPLLASDGASGPSAGVATALEAAAALPGGGASRREMEQVRKDTAQMRSDAVRSDEIAREADAARGLGGASSSSSSGGHGLHFSTEGWEASEVRAACDAMVAESVSSLDPVRREVATEVLREVVVRHSDARLYTEKVHVTALAEHALRLPIPLLGPQAAQANRLARAEGGPWCGGGAEPWDAGAAAVPAEGLGPQSAGRREAALRVQASRGLGRMSCGAPWLRAGQGMGAQSIAGARGGYGSGQGGREEEAGGGGQQGGLGPGLGEVPEGDEDEDGNEDGEYRGRNRAGDPVVGVEVGKDRKYMATWADQPYRPAPARDADLRGDSRFRRPPGPVYAPDVPCLHALSLLVPRMPGKVDRSRVLSRCVHLLNYEADLAARRLQLWWRARGARRALLSYSSSGEKDAKAQMHVVVALQLRRVLLRRRWAWMRAECEGAGVLSGLALQYLLRTIAECLDCRVAQGEERVVLQEGVLDDDGDGRQHMPGEDDGEDEEEDGDDDGGGASGAAVGDGASVGGATGASGQAGAREQGGGSSRRKRRKSKRRGKGGGRGAGTGGEEEEENLGPAHLVQQVRARRCLLARKLEQDGGLFWLPSLLLHSHLGVRREAGRVVMSLCRLRWMRAALLLHDLHGSVAALLEARGASAEEAREEALADLAEDLGMLPGAIEEGNRDDEEEEEEGDDEEG